VFLGPGKGRRFDVEAREQLIRLVRIQELANTVRDARAKVEAAPVRLEEIEGRFRERNAEYVAVKDRFEELEADRKSRSNELTGLEESRKKYQDDLMQVKNQREYAAMLKEIDAVKAQISEHEEAILRDMEEIEKLTGELATREEHIANEREAVKEESEQVEQEAAEARNTIESLGADRGRIQADLPTPLIAAVRRLENSRAGIFLSRAEDGTCLSCYVRVRPQVFQEIKQATAVHACGNCRRLLYHESSMKQTAAEPSGSTDGVEAVNGGAV
jgi:predicted  nucleic acid-binding Zn-ribbon protein